jgi:hypothetical protein
MALLCAGAIFKLPTDAGQPTWIALDLALILFTGSVLVYDIGTVVRSRRERPGGPSEGARRRERRERRPGR